MAYASATKYSGVGDGVGVGEPDGVGDGDGVTPGLALPRGPGIALLFEQPCAPTTTTAATVAAASAARRAAGENEDIGADPFSRAFSQPPATRVCAFAFIVSYVISPSTASRMTPVRSTKNELGMPTMCSTVPTC